MILAHGNATPSNTGNISTVNDPDVSPTTLKAALTKSKTGLTVTPDQILNPMVENILHDEGYDYDGGVGLPHNASDR